jgi:organic hydroperoxide reductase OsmC/OhrA
MHPFPHHYAVAATTNFTSDVSITAPGVVAIKSAGPVEFGGPGDLWSPESLLVASVADCFILSFRAIARASKFDWLDLECDVVGTLDRVERETLFTGFAVKARLTVAAGTDVGKAEKLLHKAEHSCLITNSLKGDSHLDIDIVVSDV